ncbi:hypothetical protein M426DRAFT_321159 [Hypoxylon sp. CI-4A]|nr:hypothetical protein M426DRAFT_321159 [Hypoxylon sp. CI-4A]
MLQRPRDILTAHYVHPQSAFPHRPRSYCRQQKQHIPYLNSIGVGLQSVRDCQINSFNSFDTNWNATKAKLVAQWEKITLRRQQRLKRSMVKKLTSFKNNIDRSEQLGLTSVGGPQSDKGRSGAYLEPSQVEDLLSKSQTTNKGSEQCLADFSVYTEDINTNDRYKLGDSLQKQLRTAGHMEGEKKAGAARRLSHSQLHQEGERGLTPDQFVAIKKQEAVALVMARFNQWFDKRLAIISYAYEASEALGNDAGSSGGMGCGSGDSGQGQPSRSTRSKRRLDGDDQDNSSAGGNEGDPDRGGNKRAKKDPEQDRKFACPFYKHDPRAHNKHRSCTGPGWASLHRLKEHLYRAHLLPKHTCPRCMESFDDATDLAEHIRADVPCEKLAEIPVLQGIDEATEAKLKVRRKNCPGMTDEQRWRDIYLILFPKANPNAMPTPYYDSNDSMRFSKSAEEWRKVKKRIQKELPKFVQKKVEKSFDKVERDMLVRLPDIVRDGLFEFFKDLPHDDRSASATPAATPRAHTPSLPAAKEQASMTSDDANVPPMDLSDLLNPNFGAFEEFDFTQFDFGNPTDCGFSFDKESDSGYASTSTGRGGTVEIEL